MLGNLFSFASLTHEIYILVDISDHYSLHNKTSRRRDIRQAEYLAKRAHTEQTLSSFLVVHRCRRPDTARIRFRICIDLINHY